MRGLNKLSKLLHKPLNKLANEAIREYVDRRIAEVELDLASTLEDLRAYRKRDPNFEHSIEAFVELRPPGLMIPRRAVSYRRQGRRKRNCARFSMAEWLNG